MKKIPAIIVCIIIFSGKVYAMGTSARNCAVINCATRGLIYADNSFERAGMASTTKIMTAVVALENADLGKVVTVSVNAQNQEGSSVYLRAGDKVCVEDLLYGLMLNSGNDAAVALAEGICGNTDDFVDLMNEKAAEIGCMNTHFENPSGLSEEGHYSTAYDLALIMAYAMENEAFAKIAATREYSMEFGNSVTYLRNHNKLLWKTGECIGGKTGYTKANGRCLVSCAERDGVRIAVVTLDDRDDWNDHKNLYGYAFEKLKKVKITEKNGILCTRTIHGKKVNILAGEDFSAALKNGRKNGIVCRINLDERVNGKIAVGTVIGRADIYAGKYKMGSIPVVSGQEASGGLGFAECAGFAVRRMLLGK